MDLPSARPPPPPPSLPLSGTDVALMIGSESATPTLAQFEIDFLSQYKQQHGFTCPDRDILIDDIRVRCVGGGHSFSSLSLSPGDTIALR